MIKKLLLCILTVYLMVFMPKTIVEAEDVPNYLCFEKTTEGSATVKLKQTGSPAQVTLQISNDLITWDNYTIGSEITLNFNEKLYFRNTSSETTRFNTSNNDYYYFNIFSVLPDIEVSGDTTTLINSNGNVDQLSDYCFRKLFSDCTCITTAPELPSTVLGEFCYQLMFCDNKNLKIAPQLPATSIAKSCYQEMFTGCSKLETIPEILPATILYESCYEKMFYRCDVITTPPQLPSISLAPSCYSGMFSLCKKLEFAPDLPATLLTDSCYKSMFKATAITLPPQLPATKLAPSCYEEMFSGCEQMEYAPQLPATELADSCYATMFKGNTYTLPPQLPATTLAPSCYEGMFMTCKQLEVVPQLPATTLFPYCYKSMFQSCESIIAPPQLPATIAPVSCYESMFQSCTSLVTLPELPATVINEKSYYRMFNGCKGLFVSLVTDNPSYPVESYKIPSNGQYALNGINQFAQMFNGTSGSFKSTPKDMDDGVEDNVISLCLKVFTITYDANTGSGDVPTDTNHYAYGKDVIVLDKGALTNGEMNFNGWNTKADGSGVTYMPKETFKIEGDTTLYAIWEKYQFIDGMNQTYVKESNKDSSFRCDGEYSDPGDVTVLVDKETISTDKYSLSKGSTIITLKKSYLDTLSEGWHELKVTYTDGGKASTRFYIQKPTHNPNNRHIVLDTGVN